MKITVITICRNSLVDLQLTVESVRQQRYENTEFIIIDGGSTDGTKQYLDSLPDSIVKVSEKDSGIYDAMNKGIYLSTGAYLIFMNAGDTFFSNQTIADVVAYNIDGRRTPPALIYGSTNCIYPQNFNYIWDPLPIEHLFKRMPACHQSFFFPAQLFKEKIYDISFKIAADYDLICYAFSKKYTFIKTHLIISNSQINGVSDRKRYACAKETMQISARYYKPRLRFYTYHIARILDATLRGWLKQILPNCIIRKALAMRHSHRLKLVIQPK